MHSLNSGDSGGAPHTPYNAALGGTVHFQGGPENVVSVLLKAKVSSDNSTKRKSVLLVSSTNELEQQSERSLHCILVTGFFFFKS